MLFKVLVEVESENTTDASMACCSRWTRGTSCWSTGNPYKLRELNKRIKNILLTWSIVDIVFDLQWQFQAILAIFTKFLPFFSRSETPWRVYKHLQKWSILLKIRQALINWTHALLGERVRIAARGFVAPLRFLSIVLPASLFVTSLASLNSTGTHQRLLFYSYFYVFLFCFDFLLNVIIKSEWKYLTAMNCK